MGTFSTSIHLTCLLLFPNVKPKSKQPKQLEINRKLLIKCFWGNDKTALWTYRFACVAQYLPSKFLESRAGERQFAPVVTGKVRKGDDHCPRGSTLPIISHRSGNLQSYALCNFERLSSVNVRNNSVHLQGWRARASTHDLSYLFAMSQRKINPLYWVRLWQIFNTPPQETERREKRPIDALRNRYLLILIRNINNKWKLTGTIVTESVRDNRNLDRHFHILQQTSSKSSEIVQVSDKRIRKRKSSFLTQILGTQTTFQCFNATVYGTQANKNPLQTRWNECCLFWHGYRTD